MRTCRRLLFNEKSFIFASMHLIDGKALAEKIRVDVKNEVTALGFSPQLAVLLVGDDRASKLYVTRKKKAGEEAGIRIDLRELPAETSDVEILALIENWNRDPEVDAILVQIPLPPQHDENRIIAALDPNKDVDGFHPRNVEALLAGQGSIIPPVHEGILRLINETPLVINGASAVILANSDVFANPLKRLLSSAGMFVSVMSPDALDKDKLQRADVIVIAIGRARFLFPGLTKPDAVIIDVGTNHDETGKLCGDTDIKAYQNTRAWISPVPGGVGPMTIAQLLQNVVRLARARRQAKSLAG